MIVIKVLYTSVNNIINGEGVDDHWRRKEGKKVKKGREKRRPTLFPRHRYLSVIKGKPSPTLLKPLPSHIFYLPHLNYTKPFFFLFSQSSNHVFLQEQIPRLIFTLLFH